MLAGGDEGRLEGGRMGGENDWEGKEGNPERLSPVKLQCLGKRCARVTLRQIRLNTGKMSATSHMHSLHAHNSARQMLPSQLRDVVLSRAAFCRLYGLSN